MRPFAMIAKLPAAQKNFLEGAALQRIIRAVTPRMAQEAAMHSHAWWWLHHMKFDQGPRQKKIAGQNLVFHWIEN